MATKVRIGHASTANPASGNAADEVKISDYYDINPTFILRPNAEKYPGLAEASAAACEAGCNNNKIEYSQTNRGTLYAEAKRVGYDLSKITSVCYADCSSFMTVCAIAGGANLTFSYIPTCGDMESVFTKNGHYKVLTAAKYLNSSDYLQRGDILVRDAYLNGSRHTVMVLDNGSNVSNNESINTALADVSVIKIAVNITKISSTGLTAEAEIQKIKNGKATLLTDETMLASYDWTCTLESMDNTKFFKVKSINVGAGRASININGLTKGDSYKLSVQAAEMANKTCVINSQSVIFTTTPQAAGDTKQIRFNNNSQKSSVRQAYIKLNGKINRTITYLNI